MAILLNRNTRVLVQGFTGRIGSYHAEDMKRYGTKVVGGVTPGKGGQTHLGVPVFNTVKGAVRETGADASVVFVPPPFAADSIMEAADAGIKFCVCITDGIPSQDMMHVKRYMRRYRFEDRMKLIGPNCAGIITPGQALMGIMPGNIYLPGRVGIVSRSGTLGYEAASQMKALGIGVSTSVGIGGDPINGSSFRDIAGTVRTGRRHRCRGDDRRNRRTAGSRSCRVGEVEYEEAADRLYCRSLGAEGQAHGPRRRHHLCLWRVGPGEGRDPARRRRCHRPDAGCVRTDGRRCARRIQESRLTFGFAQSGSAPAADPHSISRELSCSRA